MPLFELARGNLPSNYFTPQAFGSFAFRTPILATIPGPPHPASVNEFTPKKSRVLEGMTPVENLVDFPFGVSSPALEPLEHVSEDGESTLSVPFGRPNRDPLGVVKQFRQFVSHEDRIRDANSGPMTAGSKQEPRPTTGSRLANGIKLRTTRFGSSSPWRPSEARRPGRRRSSCRRPSSRGRRWSRRAKTCPWQTSAYRPWSRCR